MNLLTVELTDSAKIVVDFAPELAKEWGGEHTGPEHLLLQFWRQHRCKAVRVLRQMGVTESALRAAILEEVEILPRNTQPPPHSPDMEQALRLAKIYLRREAPGGGEKLNTGNLLLGCAHSPRSVAGRALRSLGFQMKTAKELLMAV